MKRIAILLMTTITTIGCTQTATTPSPSAAPATPAPAALDSSSPFFAPSPLQFMAPQFDKIKDADYQPALEEGMRRQIAEINAIASDPATPTFVNTIESMERSGDLLTRTAKVFYNLVQSNTNPTFDKIEAELPPPGRYRVVSAGRTLSIETSNDALRRKYRERFAARADALRSLASRPGVHLLECATHADARALLAQKFRQR